MLENTWYPADIKQKISSSPKESSATEVLPNDPLLHPPADGCSRPYHVQPTFCCPHICRPKKSSNTCSRYGKVINPHQKYLRLVDLFGCGTEVSRGSQPSRQYLGSESQLKEHYLSVDSAMIEAIYIYIWFLSSKN